MSREDFEGIKDHAKKIHDERVAKNPDRVAYAKQQLEKHNVEFSIKNWSIGHFHVRRKSDDAPIQFWAGTGKIIAPGSSDIRGIHNLLKLVDDI